MTLLYFPSNLFLTMICQEMIGKWTRNQAILRDGVLLDYNQYPPAPMLISSHVRFPPGLQVPLLFVLRFFA